MSWLHRLRDTLAPGQRRREIADEIEHHQALWEQQKGERRIGNIGLLQERTRDMDIFTWLETWLQDVRHAGRMLWRSPGFTVVVVLSLALGIGANAAIFSLINTVLLKTLPVPNPRQIYLLSNSDGINQPALLFSYPVLQQMEQATRGAATLGAASPAGSMPLLQPGGHTQPAETQLVSGGYFSTLAIEPARGRWINAADNRALGASPVAVLSYAFWQRQFGGDAAIVGREITLRGVPLEVVGIAPPGFEGLDPARPVDIWTPLMLQQSLHASGNRWAFNADDTKPWPSQEGEMWLAVFARLPQPAQAQALAAAWTRPLEASFHRLGGAFSSSTAPRHVELTPGGKGGDSLRSEYGAPLRALMAMVGLMLLIAITNVATLLLARMVRRRREIAIRLAVGISRARLARQLLTEGLLLTLLGGAAAVAVALGASRLMVRLAHNPFQPDLDWRVWVFLAAVALVSGLFLGVLPAWQASRGNAAEALKAEGLNPTAGAHHRVPLGRWLVIAQVAFSLVLVASAGLFSRSLAAMFQINLGFDRAHILTARLQLPDQGVPPAELQVLDQRLLERVGALPGVRSVALDQSGLDDFSADTSGISLAGKADPPGGLNANENTVSRNFFDAVGMDLVHGRGFASTDTAKAPEVVIVNQAFARHFYPGQDAVGHTFGYDAASSGRFHIIGIAADARVQDPHTPAAPLFYRLLDQSDNPPLTIEVRASGDPALLTSAVRAAATGVDSRFTLRSISTVDYRVGEMLQRDTLIAQLSSGFGGLALALACLGLYGVMAYAVAARRNEFSIRLALGADRSHVVRLVLREALVMLAGGIAFGLPLALLAARYLQPLLPGVGARDPVTLAAAVAIMAALPLLAALHPAWRASRTDAVRALRA